MKRILSLSLLGATMLMSSWCYSSSQDAEGAEQLFSIASKRSLPSEATKGYLQNLVEAPASQDVLLVDVKPELINKDTQALAVTLPNGKTARFEVMTYNELPEGMEGWVGYRPSSDEPGIDPLTYLSIIRQGEKLVADIVVEGQPYQLEYLGANTHALVTVDESKIPPEGDTVQGREIAKSVVTQAGSAQTAHSVIRILFVTTKQSRAIYTYPELIVALGLQSVNEVMKNSRINITVESAGIYHANYDESGKNYSQLLEDLAKNMKDVAQAREGLLADLVSMLVINKEWRGLAYLGPSKRLAYSVITNIPSLAHEIGHNFGMHHDFGNDKMKEVGKASYIHGYQHTRNPLFRTQMSYDCPDNSCPRIPYFSNPRVTRNFIPVGTVKDHDVARAIEERRSIVENFYSSPAAAAKVQLFEGANFKGNMCELYIEKGKTVIVKDSLCREVTTSRSVKVVNFERGNQFCLSNTDHSRQRCVSGDYKGNFEIANFDLGSPLPSGLKRSAKGYPMNGSVTEMSYKKTDETFVRLYGGDNYTSLLCTVTVGQGSAKTPNTERQCPSNVGRARSAQVIGFDGSKLCFVNADATRKHCYTGDYRGDFGIANFDQYPLVLPNGLKATRGGYMNGNVRLISKGVE